jgi:hypothetical protein
MLVIGRRQAAHKEGDCAVLTDWRGARLCGIVAEMKTPWGMDE